MKKFPMMTALACAAIFGAGIATVESAQALAAPDAVLAHILAVSNRDDEVLDNLFHRFPDQPVPKAKQLDYGRFLTRHLLDTLAAEQKKLVQSDCGGVYQKDEICGFESNPLTCSQDDIDKPKLSVEKVDATSATIRDHDGDRYTMVLDHGIWMLDAVKCKGE